MNEKLYKELMAECDRLTNILDDLDPGSENWKFFYGKKQDILEKMGAFNKVESDYVTKQEERRVQEEHNRNILEMEERKMEQHAEIEKSRKEADMALEREKKKINWTRVAIDAGMLLVPLGISIWNRKDAEKRMYDFETNGRITSTVGRQFRLPEILWKKK